MSPFTSQPLNVFPVNVFPKSIKSVATRIPVGVKSFFGFLSFFCCACDRLATKKIRQALIIYLEVDGIGRVGRIFDQTGAECFIVFEGSGREFQILIIGIGPTACCDELALPSVAYFQRICIE